MTRCFELAPDTGALGLRFDCVLNVDDFDFGHHLGQALGKSQYTQYFGDLIERHRSLAFFEAYIGRQGNSRQPRDVSLGPVTMQALLAQAAPAPAPANGAAEQQ